MGASRSSGEFRPSVLGNSDLPRKLGSLRRAYCARGWRQEPPNRDPSRKGIVTSQARSQAEYQDVPGEFLVERPNLLRGSPANRNIYTGSCRVRGCPRRGSGQYRPPTQAIVTPPASNSDPSRKGIVTSYAGNSDLPRKGIVTSHARNSDHSRKRSSSITCKTTYFLSSNPTSLLYVCMFNVPVVYRKGGSEWS